MRCRLLANRLMDQCPVCNCGQIPHWRKTLALFQKDASGLNHFWRLQISSKNAFLRFERVSARWERVSVRFGFSIFFRVSPERAFWAPLSIRFLPCDERILACR